MKKQLLIAASLLLTTVAEALAQNGDNTHGTPPADVVAVDLGLPSGIKWANMNVGAAKPEDKGLYFAWGDATGYDFNTVAYNPPFTWDDYKFGCPKKFKKYCLQRSDGQKDEKTILELEDDGARVYWGSPWRMPTLHEFRELLDNTDYEFTEQNGVPGVKFTSKKNGNTIFLPATVGRGGNQYYNVDYFKRPPQCGYWTSNMNTNKKGGSDTAWTFYGHGAPMSILYRYCFLAIRPVL